MGGGVNVWVKVLYPLGSMNVALFVNDFGSWRRCSVTEDPWVRCSILINLCFQCVQSDLFDQAPSFCDAQLRGLPGCPSQSVAGMRRRVVLPVLPVGEP